MSRRLLPALVWLRKTAVWSADRRAERHARSGDRRSR